MIVYYTWLAFERTDLYGTGRWMLARVAATYQQQRSHTYAIPQSTLTRTFASPTNGDRRIKSLCVCFRWSLTRFPLHNCTVAVFVFFFAVLLIFYSAAFGLGLSQRFICFLCFGQFRERFDGVGVCVCALCTFLSSYCRVSNTFWMITTSIPFFVFILFSRSRDGTNSARVSSAKINIIFFFFVNFSASGENCFHCERCR